MENNEIDENDFSTANQEPTEEIASENVVSEPVKESLPEAEVSAPAVATVQTDSSVWGQTYSSNAGQAKIGKSLSEGGRNLRKERIGKVVSNKMTKTITVAVDRKVKHPVYGKFMHKTTKFMAHDETNSSNIGDTVRIAETRPLSKNKRWRLVEILERAK